MQEKCHQSILLIENDNIYTKNNNNVDGLQVRLQFRKIENLLLKEEAKHKQNIIQSILNQNTELSKPNNPSRQLPVQS